MAVSLHQSEFAFGLDDGTESGHTLQATGANFVAPLDTPFTLRFAVWETGGSSAPNLVQQFQYSHNGGLWTDISTTSTVVKAVAVGAFTNGQNCTQRLSAHGTFEASGAGCTEDGSSGGNANDLSANGSTETECGLQIVGADVAQGDDIAFRLRVSGPATTIVYDTSPHALIPLSKAPAAAALSVSGPQPGRIVEHFRLAALAAVVLVGIAPTISTEAPNIVKAPDSAVVSVSGQTPKIPTLTVDLRENDTVRATRYVNLTSTAATYAFDLEASEASSIVAWDQLRYTFVANGGQVEVSWSELEAPAAESELSETPASGTLALTGTQPSVSQTAPGLSCSPGSGALSVAGATPVLPSLTFELRCGTDLIARQTITPYAGISTQSFALTDEQVWAITDWSALRFSFIASVQPAEVEWAELETPAAADAYTFIPATASISLEGYPTVHEEVVSPSAGSLVLEGVAPAYQRIQLWMGPSASGTLVAERPLAFTSSFATYEFVLSAAEFAALTDLSDLHVVITADASQHVVSWLEVEIPAPGYYPSGGTLSFAGLAPLPYAAGYGASATAAVSIVGAAPTLDRTYTVAPGSGSLSFSGTIISPVGISDVPNGAMALVGLNPGVDRGPVPALISVFGGGLAMAGIAPAAVINYAASPTTAGVVASGVVPILDRTYLVTPRSGSLALLGAFVFVSQESLEAVTKTPESGTLLISGYVPSVVQSPVGPLAMEWGTEVLVVAGCGSDSLVSSRITGDALEYVT